MIVKQVTRNLAWQRGYCHARSGSLTGWGYREFFSLSIRLFLVQKLV